MHYLIGLIFVIASAFSTIAVADDAEGKIVSINQEQETLTLDDGKTYQLAGEFDYSSLKSGMKVLIIYDVANDTRYVTDIQEMP